MTRDEALGVVLDAADRWAAEIGEYIAPAVEQDSEEHEGWVHRADEICAAIAVLKGE